MKNKKIILCSSVGKIKNHIENIIIPEVKITCIYKK